MNNPPNPLGKPSKDSPMAVKVPCLFCGARLSVEDKKTHACWIKNKTGGYKGEVRN